MLSPTQEEASQAAWDQVSMTSHERSSVPRLTKKESLRLQKKSYKQEKKKVHKELKSTIQDPSVVIFSDWLKIRSTLKNWSRMWCILKPGVLIIYRTPKCRQWVGTVLLTASEIIERPSKKEGFCFKIYHQLDQVIWTAKGPSGEGMSLLKNSLPSNHLILRALTHSNGQCWMDALELARKCSNLLKKSMPTLDSKNLLSEENVQKHNADEVFDDQLDKSSLDGGIELAALHRHLSVSHSQKSMGDGDGSHTSVESSSVKNHQNGSSEKHTRPNVADNSSLSSETGCSDIENGEQQIVIPETKYVSEDIESFGVAGEAGQTEILAGENKGLVWTILKQLRPGMDLSKVVLPTFILEPRSFLDKLSDYYFHADLLSSATLFDDPYERMKAVAKWYLSGFYKKPEGIKKPYNPIIGEIFRCKWKHPETGSFTHYIAEQVSHHPPISAFAVVNKKDGFMLHGSILAKSKFYGNSLSAFLDGTVSLTFLNRGEEYIITMPYAHCKGFLYGTMTMEFGGKVDITCQKTGFTTEIEFKLKSFFGGNDSANRITGRILQGKKSCATIQGFWDREIYLTELNRGATSIFWKPSPQIKATRLQRHIVAPDQQLPNESQNLWCHVTKAINGGDQNEATKYKCILEENQRKGARERLRTNTDWIPRLFEYDPIREDWTYKFYSKRPWNSANDVAQYECDGCISTVTKHGTRQNSPRKNINFVENHRKNSSEQFSQRLDSRSVRSSHENDPLSDESAHSFQDTKQTLSQIQEHQKMILIKLSQMQKSIEGRENSFNSNFFKNNVLICIVAIFAIFMYYYR